MKTFNLLLGSLSYALALSAAPARAQTPKTIFFGAVSTYQNKHTVVLGGGWNAQRGWLSDAGAQPSVFPGTKFGVYTTNGGRLGELTVDRPEANEDGRMARARNTLSNIGQSQRLALSGVARPFPRPVRAQKLSDPIYEKAVADFLRGRGAKVTQARLTQLWRIDLNGDKVDEVLFTAHAHAQMGIAIDAKPNDYAVAGLRFLDAKSGRIKTVALEIQVNPNLANYDAPYYYDFLGCPDLNGDGRQEIVVRSSSNGEGGGNSLSAWTFDGRTAKKVCDSWGL